MLHQFRQQLGKRKYGGDVWSKAKRIASSAGGVLVGAVGTQYAINKYMSGGKAAKVTHGSGVSLQRDTKVQYVSRHKRGWKRRARRWKRFVRKVRAVALKDHGKLTVVMDDFVSASSSAGQQCQAFVLLGGIRGNGTGEADMNFIIEDAVSQSTDASRLLINSKVLDLQITTTEATESSCELDIYEFVCIKDVPNTIFTSGAVADMTMASFYAKGLSTQPAVGGAGTQLTSTAIGVTPFDNKFFCQHFKIVKKTKHLLGLNQYVTYQIRDPKNHIFSGYQRRDLIARKGITRGVLLIAKGLVAAGAIPTTDFAVYSNRHYNFTVLQSQTDAGEIL